MTADTTNRCDDKIKNSPASTGLTITTFPIDNSTTENKNNCEYCGKSNEIIYLGNELKTWAIRKNVNHNQMGSLLQILQKYHPELPRCSKTVLGTMRNLIITSTLSMKNTPAEYFYFGVKGGLMVEFNKGLSSLLSHYNINTIEIICNVDGLPLHHSTNQETSSGDSDGPATPSLQETQQQDFQGHKRRRKDKSQRTREAVSREGTDGSPSPVPLQSARLESRSQSASSTRSYAEVLQHEQVSDARSRTSLSVSIRSQEADSDHDDDSRREHQLESSIKQQILAPHVLTLTQLIFQLQNINSKISNHVFPLPLEPSNGHLFLELANWDVYYYNHAVVFIIHIPLVDAYTYDYYQLFFLPIPDKQTTDSFHMIKPSSNYILITSGRRRFVVTNERCRIVLHMYLRKEQSAQVRRTKNPAKSLYSEVLHYQQFHKAATLSTLVAKFFTWTNVTANLWLITSSRTTTTEILCLGQNMVTTRIQNTVMIHLPPTCQAYGI
ncbi:hypothetical protein ILUMI_04018 [Ignelater luminosus]|uniref:Uncharacterized protein n=1 Tax=Ignelater luminosus TaxID=2038154 RepID=A0A8K0GEY1_IGNLU|nr:hypothetical protein ILUMI_04018 [Ignelater luminosus]